MGRVPLALVGIACGVLSCSSSNGNGHSPPPALADSAILTSPSSVVQATVEGSRIFGPQVELARDQNGLRGRGPMGVVDLRTADGSIRGVVGGAPTELYVEREGNDGFALRGLYSGGLGELEVHADRIQGQLGNCEYNMRRCSADEGTAYNGQRVCGRKWTEAATFTLSSGLAALEPVERGALIAVLLGR